MTGTSMKAAVEAAATASLTRLFPRFGEGDDPGWGKVVERAKQGNANPLGALGFAGEADKQPACAEVLVTCRVVSGPARTCAPNSWAASTAGHRTPLMEPCTPLSRRDSFAQDSTAARSRPPRSRRTASATVSYQVENVVLPAAVKIEVKGLATKLGIPLGGLPEADIPGRIVERLLTLADDAGGDPPLPASPSKEIVRDLQGLTGNELVQRIYERKADLLAQTEAWTVLAGKKAPRLSAWGELHDLLRHADEGDEKTGVLAQCDAILRDRTLLEDPDPVGPLSGQLATTLRARYSAARDTYEQARSAALAGLEADELWTKLEASQREAILTATALDGQAPSGLETTGKLLAALDETKPRDWEDRVDLLPPRVTKAREQAAKLLEPAAIRVTPPSATIRTLDDLDTYLDDLRAKVEAQLANGPVVL